MGKQEPTTAFRCFVRNTSGACMGFQRSSSMFLHWNPGHFIALFLFISVVFTSPFFVHVLLPLAAPLGEACPLPCCTHRFGKGTGEKKVGLAKSEPARGE